mgnify:CR=1 FL=1
MYNTQTSIPRTVRETGNISDNGLQEIYVNTKTSDLVFIALNALSYYTDLNDDILKKIENKLNSDDEDVRIVAKKAIKRIKIKK